MGGGAAQSGGDELAALREAARASEERARESERARVAAEERALELSVDLERARAKAREMSAQSERLFDGMRRISEAASVEQLYTDLLGLLKDVLEFEDAFIIVAEREGVGDEEAPIELAVVASSARAFEGLRWRAARCFRSVLSGKTRAAFDTSKLPEWRELPRALLERARSAMHLPIRTGAEGAILICVHSSRGFFSKSRVRLGARFSGLARNALRNAELLESQLRRLEDLSTPMIPISSSVTVMPIIGTMDRARGERLLAAALQGARERDVQRVIIDITALAELDREAARALIKTASALRLLGCQMTLSGVQPAVANTLVHIESELEGGLRGLDVCGTLQDAVTRALRGRRRRAPATIVRGTMAP